MHWMYTATFADPDIWLGSLGEYFTTGHGRRGSDSEHRKVDGKSLAQSGRQRERKSFCGIALNALVRPCCMGREQAAQFDDQLGARTHDETRSLA